MPTLSTGRCRGCLRSGGGAGRGAVWHHRREGDGASWRALAEQFEDHAWVIAAPEVREPRSAAPSLSIWTYTMHAARRHDVPVAERRVLEEMRWLVGQLSTWAERIGRELELTYEGEEIGWIVRGEVSEELRRFLDRWERTLRDDVASRVQRDEGRVDDGDEGKVSIWLGDLRDEAELAALLVPASPARSPLRRALGLRTVPEGELEARWAPRAPVAVARARSIDTASAVIAYFDHAHEPAQALPEQDGARLRFVGVFSYDEAVEARPASEVEPMPARLATQVRPWRHYLPRLHDHRAATAERLDTLERSLGATLPPDYRVFLRHLGGAVPSAGTLVSPIDDLAWKAGPVAVGEFLGFRIDGGPALDPFGRIPVDLLPIARTEGDDRFCLGIGGSYRDEVWLWAHDTPRAAAASSEGPWHECLYRVAATFAAFLERLELRPWEDSPVLDPEGVDVDAVIARSRAVAASVGQVRAAVKRSTRVVRSTAAADGAFARLVAEAPDVAIGVVRGMVPVGDADAIDVPAVAADVAHALWADAEIRNGGVAQLLHNGGRQQVERSRAALRALGLARPAAILRMAVGEGGEVELDEIDEAWYGLDPSLQAAIASVLAAQQAPWFERLAAHADVRMRVAALTPVDQLAVAIDLGDRARLERLARAAPGAVTLALLTQAVEKRSTTSRVAIVERLLAASPGADLRTLLRTAISAASPGMVRVLLHHGADVAPDPATGATPLAAARDVETARLLIAAGVSARIADHAGRTALHFAGSVDVVRVLLSAGADARVVDATGATVLHHALDAAAIDLLIQHGAEPDREDAAGVTPLMRQADPESMAALARHGASYDSVDRRGRTALHHHAGDRCTQHLLTIGLDPLRSDAAGETPLALARANDHFGGRYVRMHEVAADIEPDPGPPTPPVAEPRPDAHRHRR